MIEAATIDIERAFPPKETLQRIKPWLSKAGISRVADITGMDRIGIPVFISIRPDSKSLAVDSGKGHTKDHARCSAIMESLERWVADEVALPCFHHSGPSLHFTDFPKVRGCPPGLAIEHWTLATHYEDDGEAFVPYYAVKLYDRYIPLADHIYQASTNGLASGNTRDEAILSGLFERIERDAVHIAQANHANHAIDLARLDLGTVTDATCCELIEKIQTADAGIFVYDVTADIPVPTYVAVISDSARGVGLYKGYGTHLRPEVALRRAICEAAQSRAVMLSGSRDDFTYAKHRFTLGVTEDIDWQRQLAGEKCRATFDGRSPYNELSVRDTIKLVSQILKRHQIGPVLVVDFPVETDLFFVCKVMVPGLAGYWNNWVEPSERCQT